MPRDGYFYSLVTEDGTLCRREATEMMIGFTVSLAMHD